MTDILAHDIDGRPLRAGDRVVLLSANRKPNEAGRVVTILGPPSEDWGCDFDIDVKHPYGGWFQTKGENVRRLEYDQTPAETGFTELMTNLKTGSLEPLEIE